MCTPSSYSCELESAVVAQAPHLGSLLLLLALLSTSSRRMAERSVPRTRTSSTSSLSLIAALLALCALLLLRQPSSSAPATMSPPADSPSSARGRQLRIGSLNIRYDYHARHPVLSGALSLGAKVGLASSGACGKEERYGERRWAERREALMDLVRWEELDVIGFQEVLWGQLSDLRELLGEDEWSFVGVGASSLSSSAPSTHTEICADPNAPATGRDDGREKGEAVPIFFRRSRLTLLSTTHRWLSPTPTKPGSKGWDAGQPRMVTLARFRDQGGDGTAEVLVANTHWDDRGLDARTQSAKLILQLVAEELAAARAEGSAEPLAVVLGDLNSPAEEDGYQVLTGRRYPHEARVGVGKNDDEAQTSCYDARHELAVRGSALAGPGALSRCARSLSSLPSSPSTSTMSTELMHPLSSSCSRYGPLNTFTGFNPSDEPKVIDFILPLANAAFLPLPSSSSPSSSSISAAPPSPLARPPQWKVGKYGVVQHFFEDLAGRRPAGEEGREDAMVRSDHRLVVARFEEAVERSGRAVQGEGERVGAREEVSAGGSVPPS